MAIQPRTLKGFRDFLPNEMRIRQYVIETFKRAFERYGYEPLETPVLEYADILMGKYGEEAEQMMYRFRDRGDRDVAMKYDLTVPACRVIAQYQEELPLPFKRYQIQPVWRAENTQKGRFREFYQCDADTFGSNSLMVEAEYLAMGVEAITSLGFQDVVVRINNRKIIDGMTKYAGATDEEFYTICIAVDKLDKVGKDGVIAEMSRKGIAQEKIDKVMEVISLAGNNDMISNLKAVMKNIPIGLEGIAEMEELLSYLTTMKVPEKNYLFDITIIRGLSYYTGPVWEFSIKDGGVGSVGGGGRYDNLVSTYLGRDIPASGGSFGIERLIEIIKDRNLLNESATKPVLVTIFSPELAQKSIEAAAALRKSGENVMLFPDNNTKLEKQLKYANKKGFTQVVIIGQDEANTNTAKIKDMSSGKERTVSLAELG